MLMRTLRTKTRSIMIIVAIVFVLSTLGIYMMRGSGGGGTGGEVQGDYAVASIDGKKVMRSDIDMGVRNLAQQNNASDVTYEDVVRMRKSVLDNMAIYEELKKETAARGIEVEEAEVDEAVRRIEDQFPTKEAFQQYMQNNQIQMKDLREEIGLRLAQQKLLDQVIREVEISEDEVRGFYDETKEFFFTQPAGYEVTYGRFASMDVAESAMERITGGENWNDVMDGIEEGLLDWIRLDEPVFVAARELETGELQEFSNLEMDEVGGPVEFGEGNVIVLAKRARIDQQTLSFDEVSGDVIQILESEKIQQNEQDFFADLLERADVKVLNEEYFTVPESPESVDQDGGTVDASGQAEAPEETGGETESALTE